LSTGSIEEEWMASFTGTWQGVSSPDFDEDYLGMEVDPYVILKQSGDRMEGKYQVGLQSGSLDGWLENQSFMLFSFEGIDELEEMHGAGRAMLSGDHLTFELRYFLGDEYVFDCERSKSLRQYASSLYVKER
jgi:hypothetical protein